MTLPRRTQPPTSPSARSLPAARLHPALERVLVAVFALTILLPGLATMTGLGRASEADENRALAPLPRLVFTSASLAAFPDAFTRYFEDNFED